METTTAHEAAAAITVAEFARRSACGDILSENERVRCATAHRMMLGTDETACDTDDAEDDLAFSEVFGPTHGFAGGARDGVAALAGFFAGIAGTLLALAAHTLGG
jgi:hypothetical protein